MVLKEGKVGPKLFGGSGGILALRDAGEGCECGLWRRAVDGERAMATPFLQVGQPVGDHQGGGGVMRKDVR